MKKISACIMLCVAITVLPAHEYILISEKYFLQKGDPMYVHLFVAQGFNVELERPLQKNITKSFFLETEKGITNLLQTGIDGQHAVYEDTVDFDGLGLLSMQRDHARISLPPAEFAEYIKEDHLDNIHFDAKNTTAEQREKYSRYLKCLVLSGDDASGDLYKKELNFNLEIILLENPYTKKAGDELSFQVKFMGKPLQDKIVTARNRTGDENTISTTVKTNEEGIAKVLLQREGTWLLHLTHMIPCTDTSDSDWESFWASYSFGVAE